MIAAFALLFAHGASLQGPDTLDSYIASLHWDPAKSGPLISIASDQVPLYNQASHDLSVFERKCVKVGGLSVIAPNWTIDLDESTLPNAFQELHDEEKFDFLLANLSPSDLSKLTGEGVTAQELSGDQRLALLSLIPQPLKVVDYTSTSRNVDTVPNELREQIRVQLRKGVNVSYKVDPGEYEFSLDSIDYNGPTSPSVVRSSEIFRSGSDSIYPGQVIESYEKMSQLSYTAPRLAVPIELKNGTELSKLMSEVRSKTGLEVYADARIGPLMVGAKGAAARAGDLLRGLAIAVNGTYRSVGPAYVLTASLNGEETREAWLYQRSVLGRRRLKLEIDHCKQVIQSKKLLDAIGFSQNDPLQPENIAAEDLSDDQWSSANGWVPIGDVPSALQAAVTDAAKHAVIGNGDQSDPATRPAPKDVRVTTCFDFRLILPGGKSLGFSQLQDMPPRPPFSSDGPLHSRFPLEFGGLKEGSAVAIRSNDPTTVTDLCSQLKALGVTEVWIESDSQQAISAAISSGLRVDLVVEPWRVLKGESCPDPDRNVIGLTGSQVSALKAENNVRPEECTEDLMNCFSPESAGVTKHLERVFTRVPAQGLNRVILLDAQPPGYGHTSPFEPKIMAEPLGATSIEDVVFGFQSPVAEKFGFSTALRLRFLREHQIDPIDITGWAMEREAPLSLYFDRGPYYGQYNPYPNAHFQFENPRQRGDYVYEWETLRSEAARRGLLGLMSKLSSTGRSVWVEGTGRYLLRLVTPELSETFRWEDVKGSIQVQPMSPQLVEDEEGSLVYEPQWLDLGAAVCFDLREVPIASFPAYLRYIFKKPR